MSAPTPTEETALEESGPLLRYAAEHVKNLDPNIPLAVAEAVQAKENSAWTPQTAQSFWNAFAKLSDLIDPVTIDCLKSVQPTLTRKRWGFIGPAVRVSLAGLISGRVLMALMASLAVIVPLELYVSSINILSDNLKSETAEADALTNGLRASYTDLSVKTDGLTKAWSPAMKEQADRISQQSDDLSQRAQLAWSTAASLDGWLSLGPGATFNEAAKAGARFHCAPDAKGKTSENDWWCRFNRATHFWSETADKIAIMRARTQLMVGVINAFILPALLGLTGSLAYVARLIAEQIRSTTFSSASPVRHLMRIGLGLLMGSVAGLFSGLTQSSNLPPLAIAFLAGYAVEAVFVVFDSLISGFQKALK